MDFYANPRVHSSGTPVDYAMANTDRDPIYDFGGAGRYIAVQPDEGAAGPRAVLAAGRVLLLVWLSGGAARRDAGR